ncbi:MAG: hypothetical protein IMF17_05270 [Proteobacteria bacterium]|nr:hypothetical protein [Pseudomonadota bacterium]
MNDCCKKKDDAENGNTEGEFSKKASTSHCCPSNGKPYKSVKRKTLLHHILKPWSHRISIQDYFFCTDPKCDVVYFGEDDSVVHTDELRTTVWQKSSDKNAAICYCFGISKALAQLDKNIKNFVKEQTKQSNCSCETSNPSGRCCLKDFPK